MQKQLFVFWVVTLIATACFTLFPSSSATAGTQGLYYGTHEIMIHDDIDGTVKEHHFLNIGDNKLLRLMYKTPSTLTRFKVKSSLFPKAVTANTVRVFGLLKNSDELHVDRIEEPEAAPDDAPGSSGYLNVIGERKMCVILIQFPSLSNTYNPDQLRTGIFGSTGRTTNNLYKEASRGKMWIAGLQNPAGDIFGPITVNTNGCETMSYSQISTDALNQVAATGVSVNSYQHRVFYFPANAPNCPGGGIGGGNNVWIFGIGVSGAWDYVGHEAGHGFGLSHASSYDNCSSISGNVVSVPQNFSGCTHNEYGDQTDIMGGRNFQFSSWHMERCGWLVAGNILELTRSARVSLVPSELEASGIQSLRVPRTDGTCWHFEYRQKIGEFDRTLETALTNGALVRYTPNPRTRGNTRIIDMTPANNLRDATLVPGRTFTADNDAIRVTTISATAQECVLDVMINGEPVSVHRRIGGDGTLPSDRSHFFIRRHGSLTAISLPAADAQNLRGVEVFDGAGRSVTRLAASGQKLVWDGTAPSGSPIKTGVYILKFDCGSRTLTRTAVITR
ncbi:MAG: hypothetical protein JXA71_20080 [Chitinispirillaceae bacterium]|nr:hypothetical protein [Chitinispirillaceae bacterium]